MKNLKTKILTRAFQIETPKTTKKEGNNFLTLSFSSEYPVRRVDKETGIIYEEILLHNPENVRFERLKKTGQLISEHVEGTRHGKVIDGWVENKKGYATIKFSRKKESQDLFLDIQDKIATNTSFRYDIHDYKIEEIPKNEIKDDVSYRLIATDWEPLEISDVSIPADPTVGYFRSLVNKNKNFNNKTKELDIMPDQVIYEKTDSRSQTELEIARIKKQYADDLARERKKFEHEKELEIKRRDDIRKFAKNLKDFPLTGGESIDKAAQRYIDENLPFEAFSSFVSQNLGKPRTLQPLGLSRKDIRDFNFTEFLRGIGLGIWKGQTKEETIRCQKIKEITEATRSHLNRGLNTFSIPIEVLTSQKRFLGVSTVSSSSSSPGYVTESSGSNLVATDLRYGDFISYLYDNLVLTQMGARIMPGLVGNVDIPKQTGAPGYHWATESDGTTAAETDYTSRDDTLPQYAKVSLSPKNVFTNNKYTRQYLLQNPMAVEQNLRQDQTIQLRQAIQKAAILGGLATYGDAGSPTGIIALKAAATPTETAIASKNTGSGTVAMTWADIIELKTEVKKHNHTGSNMAWLTSSQGAGYLETTLKNQYGSTYLLENGKMAGFPVFDTNMLPDNYLANSKSNNSLLILGIWNHLKIGEWGGFDFIVDDITYKKMGGIEITGIKSLDLNVDYTSAFQFKSEWSA